MKSVRRVLWAALCVAVVCAMFVSSAPADMFGTGTDQFTIDFVPISAATNPTQQEADDGAAGYGIVDYDYRISVFQITNVQFDAFEDTVGATYGSSYWTGDDIPVNQRTWDHAAHFVNWLNTSTGHQAAYQFVSGIFKPWDAADAWGGTNLYRHKAAYYFLPDEHEWVKAGYWNGTTLQTYSNADAGDLDGQGHPNKGAVTGWNYADTLSPSQPWAVGSGVRELNGTYDMMGNVWELMESPGTFGDYTASATRGVRGGSYSCTNLALLASSRISLSPTFVYINLGFRVASVPEPAGATMLLAGAVVALLWRRRRNG